MKFPQLPVGSRFAYQGETLVKTTPLVAVLESTGQQKFMPRSAEVTPLPVEGTSEPEPAPAPRPLLDGAEVEAAFADFHETCRSGLEALHGDAEPGRLEAAREELERARARFLHRLRLPG